MLRGDLQRSLPGSPIDSTGHGSRLAGKVVAEIQRVEVEKRPPGDFSDGGLSHLGKDGIAELVKQGTPHSGRPI